MRVKIKTLSFQSALAKVSPIMGGRTTLPILSCVLIEAKDGALTLTSNNLDACVQAKAECEGSLAPLCVHLRAIQAAANTPADELEFSMNGPRLRVKGSGECNLSVLDAAEFPAMPKDKWVEIGVNGKDLAELIRGVAWCAVEEPSRAMVDAVWIKTEPKSISTASTDSRQAAYANRASVCAKAEIMFQFKYADMVCDALTEGASVAIGEKYLRVVSESITIYAKLLEGKFFDMSQLLNADFNTVGKLETKPLLDALETCHALANGDPSCSVRLDFAPTGLSVGFVGKTNEYKTALDGKYESHGFTLDCVRAIDCFKHIGEIATVKFDGTNIRLENGDFVALLARMRDAR